MLEQKLVDTRASASAFMAMVALNSLACAIAVLDPDGVIVAVNQAWKRFGEAGDAPAHLIEGVGVNYLEVCRQTGTERPDQELLAAEHGIRDVIAGLLPEFRYEYSCHSPTEQRWFELHATPLLGSSGHVVVIHWDITKRVIADKALDETARRLKIISDVVPGVVFEFRMNADGSYSFPFASQALRQLYRIAPEEVRDDGFSTLTVVHPDDLPGLVASIQNSKQSLSRWRHRYRLKFDDGTVRCLSGDAIPKEMPDGSTVWYGILTDITDDQDIGDQLTIARTAFETQEGMFVTDDRHRILRVNGAFTRITGYSADEAIGQTPKLLKSGRHDEGFYAELFNSLRRDGSWQGEIWNRRKSGEIYPQWLTITAVKDPLGRVTHYVATQTDATQRKAADDEIAHLAYYDTLTNLPNRRLLLDQLHHALARSGGCMGAVMLLDMDNFKALNDTLGHDIGDQFLVEVARRVEGCVRRGDMVARLGGDEFVVLVDQINPGVSIQAVATQVAGKILRSIAEPYLLHLTAAGLPAEPRVYQATASIGIVPFDGNNASVDQLLRQADTAMYQAKAAGRNRLRFFDPAMQIEIDARVAMEHDLRAALKNSQFLLYYQAQVDDAGRVVGAEALVRWQHPCHGLVSPAKFIPVAEETGLILDIGRWVLQEACRQLVVWAGDPSTDKLTIAVNVSARQFREPNFVEDVIQVIRTSGANPTRLKLELTESLLLEDVQGTIARMTALQAGGVSFSLDDFGTGYSSLAYLKRLPLDQLKIDQSFVKDLMTDPNDLAITRSIVSLAQTMGLSVIAEGVETLEQRNLLLDLGCQMFQGYLFARPVPASQFRLGL